MPSETEVNPEILNKIQQAMDNREVSVCSKQLKGLLSERNDYCVALSKCLSFFKHEREMGRENPLEQEILGLMEKNDTVPDWYNESPEPDTEDTPDEPSMGM